MFHAARSSPLWPQTIKIQIGVNPHVYNSHFPLELFKWRGIANYYCYSSFVLLKRNKHKNKFKLNSLIRFPKSFSRFKFSYSSVVKTSRTNRECSQHRSLDLTRILQTAWWHLKGTFNGDPWQHQKEAGKPNKPPLSDGYEKNFTAKNPKRKKT